MNNDNIKVDAKNLRDAFFTDGEKKMYSSLINKSSVEKLVACNLIKDSRHKALYEKAMNLIDRAEAGEFTDAEMEKVELVIARSLAAIEGEDLSHLSREDYPENICKMAAIKKEKVFNYLNTLEKTNSDILDK